MNIFLILFLLLMPISSYCASQSSTSSSSLSSSRALTPQEFSANLEKQRKALQAKHEYDLKEQARIALQEHEQEEKDKKQRESESKEVKAQETKGVEQTEQEATCNASAQAVPLEASPKGSVKTLEELATEQLKKVFQDTAHSLAKIWQNALPTDDFNILLKRSRTITRGIDRMLNTKGADKGNAVLSTLLGVDPYLLITTPLLKEEYISTAIGALTLCATVARWPQEIRYNSSIYNSSIHHKNDFIVATVEGTVYVFNCITHTMTTIHNRSSQEPTFISLSYDGSLLALGNLIPNKWDVFTVDLYQLASGNLVHSIAEIINPNFALSLPIFIGQTTTDQVMRYNYATGATAYTPLKQSHVVISSQGLFTMYRVNTFVYNIRPLIQRNNDISRPFLLPKSDAHTSTTWFNRSESMLFIFDFSNNTLELFKTDPGASQEPYLKLCNIDALMSSTRHQLFSPDDTQLIVITRDKTAELYDVTTKKRIEQFPSTEMAFFLSQDFIVLYKNDNTADLYQQSTKITMHLGSSIDRDSNDGEPYGPRLFEKDHHTKCLYNTRRKPKSLPISHKTEYNTELYILDITTQKKCAITPAGNPNADYTPHIDTQGDIFLVNQTGIQQLMIDPTDCTLDQLFFLLGLAHAKRPGANTPKIYRQLLASPLLATFSPKIQTYLTERLNAYFKTDEYLENYAPAAPSSFFTTPYSRIPFGTVETTSPLPSPVVPQPGCEQIQGFKKRFLQQKFS